MTLYVLYGSKNFANLATSWRSLRLIRSEWLAHSYHHHSRFTSRVAFPPNERSELAKQSGLECDGLL
jgi:hypothetical protein